MKTCDFEMKKHFLNLTGDYGLTFSLRRIKELKLTRKKEMDQIRAPLGQGSRMSPPAVLAMVTQSTRYSVAQELLSKVLQVYRLSLRQKIRAGRNALYNV